MAVELKELRIGNHLKIGLPNIFNAEHCIKILEISDFIIKENFQPIELTPKLLEKFGFRQSTAQTSGYIYNYVGLTELKSFIILFDNECIEGLLGMSINNSEWIDVNIKHLHQLQNLFYALVGVELNDIVAYNYYLEIAKDVADLFKFTFEEFLLKPKNILPFCNYQYLYGDLPPNLFA